MVESKSSVLQSLSHSFSLLKRTPLLVSHKNDVGHPRNVAIQLIDPS